MPQIAPEDPGSYEPLINDLPPPTGKYMPEGSPERIEYLEEANAKEQRKKLKSILGNLLRPFYKQDNTCQAQADEAQVLTKKKKLRPNNQI